MCSWSESLLSTSKSSISNNMLFLGWHRSTIPRMNDYAPAMHRHYHPKEEGCTCMHFLLGMHASHAASIARKALTEH